MGDAAGNEDSGRVQKIGPQLETHAAIKYRKKSTEGRGGRGKLTIGSRRKEGVDGRVEAILKGLSAAQTHSSQEEGALGCDEARVQKNKAGQSRTKWVRKVGRVNGGACVIKVQAVGTVKHAKWASDKNEDGRPKAGAEAKGARADCRVVRRSRDTLRVPMAGGAQGRIRGRTAELPRRCGVGWGGEGRNLGAETKRGTGREISEQRRSGQCKQTRGARRQSAGARPETARERGANRCASPWRERRSSGKKQGASPRCETVPPPCAPCGALRARRCKR